MVLESKQNFSLTQISLYKIIHNNRFDKWYIKKYDTKYQKIYDFFCQ